MRISPSRARIAVVLAAAALITTACATTDEPEPIMDLPAAQPSDEVIGQGTVIQKPESTVQLCLGAITMIYPPDCGGPEVVGWNWDEVEGAESANGTTWGSYAVQGNWDGERLTVTEPPIMLALYDPMVAEDPYSDPANPGMTSDDVLAGIQADLASDSHLLGAFVENGYLFVDVIHDDGTLQSELDAKHGVDVVVVRSQLAPVS